jgi:hypothetical protein
MLTIESDELACLDYSGFSENEIAIIRETFVLFQHFSFSEYTAEGSCVYLHGEMFGKSTNVYCVNKTKYGIRVEVFDKGLRHFAVNFWKDPDCKLGYSVHKLSM